MNWQIGGNNMKFLVVGCNGMAGHIISIYLKENGNCVEGYARSSSPYIDTIIGDVNNVELLKKTVVNGKYDSVINCVGLLNQFAEKNKSQAVFVNSYIPHFLADITRDINTQIIHLSTDCVFSGKKGKYTEDDIPDGATFYDRTKALGEIVDDKNITLRNSIVGPDIKKSGIGLLNWFLQQDDEVNGYVNSIWTGQTTLQLAKTIEYAAKYKISGLYNMVPDSSINKYELLKLFNKYIRKDTITIMPVNNEKVDKSLIRTKFNDFKYNIPDYETMVKDLAQWMKEHSYLYPHYNIK